jgi:hypothetical protein
MFAGGASTPSPELRLTCEMRESFSKVPVTRSLAMPKLGSHFLWQ